LPKKALGDKAGAKEDLWVATELENAAASNSLPTRAAVKIVSRFPTGAFRRVGKQSSRVAAEAVKYRLESLLC
jgi:hypothetical protein